MSDQYMPPKQPGYTPATPATEPFRTTAAPPLSDRGAARDPASGFGAGTLVAIVFVVVAIMAAIMFGYSRNNMPVSNVPATTTAAPATTAPANPAPAPMATTPAPDATAPATPAPGTTAPAAPANP